MRPQPAVQRHNGDHRLPGNLRCPEYVRESDSCNCRTSLRRREYLEARTEMIPDEFTDISADC